MGRPPTIPGALPTRDRILRAAIAVFARDGVDRATLADIAAAAGLSRPSLLHHFETKDALYAEVVTVVFTTLAEALVAAFSDPTATWEQRLRATCRVYEEHLQAHRAEARLVAREIVEGDGPGAQLVRERALPLLDAVCAFVATGPIRPGLPVRNAVLWVVSDTLLSAAATPTERSLGHDLWGPSDLDRTWLLTRTLFLPDPPSSEAP